MSIDEIKQLKNGLYMVLWKMSEGGGYSLAAVGRRRDGDVWFSPTNWSTPDADLVKHADKVDKMILIASR